MSSAQAAGTRRFVPTCRERDLYLGYRTFALTLAPEVARAIKSEHGQVLTRALKDADHPFWGEHWHAIERQLIEACNANLKPGLRFGQSAQDPTEIGVFDETDR
ncbi:hypothetical protein [Cupriavidus sp. DL-D2]|uniref:hypothetical protein n=1 Tax=Cupriavidus sp. DL-D2 TaxID=3144974 RepID=UPI003214E4E8